MFDQCTTLTKGLRTKKLVVEPKSVKLELEPNSEEYKRWMTTSTQSKVWTLQSISNVYLAISIEHILVGQLD